MSRLIVQLKARLSLIAGLFRRVATDRRLKQEFQFHLEMETEANLRAGMTPEAARRAARLAFGSGVEFQAQAVDETRSRTIDDLWQDVRVGARSLLRTPTFTAVAVAVLAIGIGGTTIFFSVADHVILRPLPYPNADRLVIVREIIKEFRDRVPNFPANAGHFLEWRRRCTSCRQLGAIRAMQMTLSGGERPERIGVARISATILPLLGARAALGRLFRDDEDRTGGPRVAILSDALWRRLGADPKIVGTTMTFDDGPWEIVGVLPRAFHFPRQRDLSLPADYDLDLFVPMALASWEIETRGNFEYAVIGELNPTATLGGLQAELDAIAIDLTKRIGGEVTFGAVASGLQRQIVGSAQTGLLLLLAAVAAVLLIVSVNLANLLLARNLGRAREWAVRVAIGARGGRLVRQTLSESLTLSLAGGALGVVVAMVGLPALLSLAPPDLPRLSEIVLDGRVLAVALLLSLGVGLGFGILPAIRASRTDPADALRASGRSTTPSRRGRAGSSAVIGVQAALSALLLATTGLFVASFVRVMQIDLGFEVGPVLAVDLTLPSGGYQKPELRSAAFAEMIARIGALPGVKSAALATGVPLEGDTQVDQLMLESDARRNGDRPLANIRWVSMEYFQTIGTPIRRGRTFTDADRGRPVVVLSEAAAAALWPGADPIGKRVIPGSNDPAAEVIGTVADIRTGAPDKVGSLIAYLPYQPRPPFAATILVKATREPGALTRQVTTEINAVAPTAPVSRPRTLPEVHAQATAQRRFQLLLMLMFAGTAVITAAVGLYGIVAHSLGRRRTEIGVRLALGARPTDVQRQVLREGLTPVMVGIGIGIVLAIALGRLVTGLLFEVRPTDPITLGAVSAVLLGMAAAACWIPARRASRQPPLAALRMD